MTHWHDAWNGRKGPRGNPGRGRVASVRAACSVIPAPWRDVVGFAGFALFRPAVAGAADPCRKAAA